MFVRNDAQSGGEVRWEMHKTFAFVPGNVLEGPEGEHVLDEASIGAVRHEYRHMLDDFDLGHPGMRVIADSDLFWRLEYRGYMEEIKLAREIRDFDAGRFILQEMRARRQEILGR